MRQHYFGVRQVTAVHGDADTGSRVDLIALNQEWFADDVQNLFRNPADSIRHLLAKMIEIPDTEWRSP
jgi:hypothetical protein